MTAVRQQDRGFLYAPGAFAPSRAPDARRACFRVRKGLEGVVHDTVALEGNPFTLPEVKTLLGGIAVGGHRLEDERQVLNQAASWKELLARVEAGAFAPSRRMFCALCALVAQEEAPAWASSAPDRRPSPERITSRRPGNGWRPSSNAAPRRCSRLPAFTSEPSRGSCSAPCAGSSTTATNTARLTMNGILLAAGEDAISVPARRRLAFNEAMLRFYGSRDGTEMMRFMASCSLDPDLPAGVDP